MASTSTPTKKSKSKQPARELDTSNATKGVWLIKVPNYLSDVWKEAEPNSDLGIMRISSYVCTCASCMFNMPDASCACSVVHIQHNSVVETALNTLVYWYTI